MADLTAVNAATRKAAISGSASMGTKKSSGKNAINGTGDEAIAHACCVYRRDGKPDPYCIIQDVTGNGGVGGILNTAGSIGEVISNVSGALNFVTSNLGLGEIDTSKMTQNTDLMGLGNDTVVLPLPSNISSNLTANWDDKDVLDNLKGVAGAMGDAMGRAGQMIPSGGGKGGGKASALFNFLGNMGGVAGAIGTAVNEGAGLVGRAYIGFKELQYSGPEFRQFNLNWTLTPRDQKDFEMIVKVVQTLKSWAAPENRSGITKYPNLVQMGFSNDIRGVPVSLPARIIDVQVSFGGNSNNGSPNLIEGGGATSYNLSLTLREAVYLTKNDISNGI